MIALTQGVREQPYCASSYPLSNSTEEAVPNTFYLRNRSFRRALPITQSPAHSIIQFPGLPIAQGWSIDDNDHHPLDVFLLRMVSTDYDSV